jgi:hypothetical protein
MNPTTLPAVTSECTPSNYNIESLHLFRSIFVSSAPTGTTKDGDSHHRVGQKYIFSVHHAKLTGINTAFIIQMSVVTAIIGRNGSSCN